MSDADCTPGREPRSVAASLTYLFSYSLRMLAVGCAAGCRCFWVKRWRSLRAWRRSFGDRLTICRRNTTRLVRRLTNTSAGTSTTGHRVSVLMLLGWQDEGHLDCKEICSSYPSPSPLCDPCLSTLSVPLWPKKCCINTLPSFPLVDIIWAMMIAWRTTGKIIRTVQCCVVYDSCTQWYMHTYMSCSDSWPLVWV